MVRKYVLYCIFGLIAVGLLNNGLLDSDFLRSDFLRSAVIMTLLDVQAGVDNNEGGDDGDDDDSDGTDVATEFALPPHETKH